MRHDEKKYLDLMSALRSADFVPGLLVEGVAPKEKITGLYLNCPGILKESRLEAVRAAIGEKFTATFFPNSATIEIRAVAAKSKKGTWAAS
jgi:hypothetical protein